MANVANSRSRRVLTIGTYGILVVVGLVIVFPFVLALTTSFKSAQDVFRYPPRLLPRRAVTVNVTPQVPPSTVAVTPTTISKAASDLLGIDITQNSDSPPESNATVTTNPFLGAADTEAGPVAKVGAVEAKPLYTVLDDTGKAQRWVLVEDGISGNVYVDPQRPSFTVVKPSADVTDLGRTAAFEGEQRPIYKVPVGSGFRELVQRSGFAIAGRYADPKDLSKYVLRLKADATPTETVSFRTKNYPDLLKEVSVDRSLTNTILVTVLVVLGQCVTSILGGYAFARLKFKGRDKVFLAYLGSSMIPFVVLIVPLFQQVVAIDWKDRLVVLIIPFLFTPYGTFLMRQFFLQLPVELEEAAVIDGASRSRILWRILVPNARPAIATLASFSFLYAWNSFLWPFIAINSGNKPNHVLSISLSVLGGQGADNPQLTLVAVVISMLPPILVFISSQRYFVESAASSAVKG